MVILDAASGAGDTGRVMSQPLVEILRAGFDAFNRGDYESWLEAFSEDVEVHDLAEAPDTGVFRGHAGVRAWLAKLQEAWGDEFRFEPRSFTEGDEVAVADVQATATGIGGGVPIEMSIHLAFRFRDGEVVWTQGFLNRGAALEAVGLRE